MSHQQEPRQDQPAIYQIRVQGRIGNRRAGWLAGLEIVPSSENDRVTTLAGTLADQAALMGLLQTLYSLGFPLLLVQREEMVS